MPISVHVAIYVGKFHDVEVLVSDKVFLTCAVINNPNHTGPIYFEPEEVLLKKLVVSGIIHSSLYWR